ncbi:MAG: type II toxin-antitoxin system Phd/YefM family antitoxin [Geodermatophilaceae bacterium]|jgi:prevent-host-death family protein|nr:type II toxin-antitoxin system Phd/YefM family antitoxin [Geodermatophilaceae bacterium]MDQ3464655.1 type II toxin-antitoxin system prevent-host-death family antitoxin [Actinomycetota bacterium]
MESIGVRELRQYASRYLARVAAGESLQITDRGRPVARLVPPAEDSWEQMIATGEIIPPELPGGLLAEPPSDYGISASEELARLREHER